MAVTNTYVTSVNGQTGDRPYEMDRLELDNETGDYNPIFGQVHHHHGNVWLDANNFYVSGPGGRTIPQEIQSVASTMRPLILERIDETDDYVMHVEAGIPYEPIVEA